MSSESTAATISFAALVMLVMLWWNFWTAHSGVRPLAKVLLVLAGEGVLTAAAVAVMSADARGVLRVGVWAPVLALPMLLKYLFLATHRVGD